MGGFLETVTDDWLGLDPNGGGIYDIPVVGDIADDVLGLDPGNSPLEHLLKIAGWATAGTVAAGVAGVGPLAGTVESLRAGASIADVLPNWASLSGAEQANVASQVAAESGGWFTGPELLNAAQTGSQVVSGASALAGQAQNQQDSSGGGGWLQTLGNIANTAGSIAGAVGAGAEVYDAITGEGAEADREHARRTVADVAPLTALQQEGITSGADAARDPRLQQAQTSLFDAQQRGSGALGTGLGVLEDIATGSDAYTQRLGQQTAAASDLGASTAGVVGSARAERAKQEAVADAIASRNQSAANTLASRGQGLLGLGSDAYNLGQAPGTTLRNLGSIEQQQQQNLNTAQAAREAAAGREATGVERVGQIAGGIEALPTAIDQGRQGVNSLLGLFG